MVLCRNSSHQSKNLTNESSILLVAHFVDFFQCVTIGHINFEWLSCTHVWIAKREGNQVHVAGRMMNKKWNMLPRNMMMIASDTGTTMTVRIGSKMHMEKDEIE